ncbi:bifunctional diguanylate cyclase/phosphodiesterase [Acidocella sp.]|uniref:putative bifunctional diguanylate cyclase/phosphodiesterase n=1 Tax=Acidocella sp. TaxID=50710 RepID=UPI002626F058|nr:bifunctional diguanylate cyclase/phosphodiesterase [Acidocella sp.]
MLMHNDLLAGVSLFAALLLLAGVLVAMRADHLFIRRRLEAEAENRRLWAHGLADASFDGMLIHRQGVILLMNHALVRMLAVREREWLGQNFCTLAREDDVAGLRAELEAPGLEPVHFRLLRANKGEITVEMSSQATAFEGQPATVTALRDITRRLADEATIDHLTNHDALTGLANRRQFERIIESTLVATDPNRPVSLMITDIQGFKAVNQQFGRKAGDALLQQLTQRITGLLPREDVLARLSGDKFAVLLRAEGPPSRGLSLGGQMLASCTEPFIIDGRLITVRLSAGLAMFPEHAADAEALLRAAELALARAQTESSGIYLFRHEDAAPARPAVATRTAEPGNLRDDLRSALARGDIRLLYQPAFTLPEFGLHGFEASARWQHPVQGLLRPEQFMGIAESAGLAQELGSQLIERACAEAVASGTRHLAVNLSPAEFRDVNLPARLAAILRKTGLAPGALEVEVTEAMLAEHADYAAALLQALRNSGVLITLDDFGAGAAPLGALCHLPLARLKIGQRFIHKLGQDRNAEAMLSATLSLAANLHLQVTALGVETEAQLELLRRQGCHAVQGPLLGEPASRCVSRPVNATLAAI